MFLILGNARHVKVSVAVLALGKANHGAQTPQEQSSEFCRQVVPLYGSRFQTKPLGAPRCLGIFIYGFFKSLVYGNSSKCIVVAQLN